MNWPATGDELKAAGYRSIERGVCRSCNAPIIWTRTPLGAVMPMREVTSGPLIDEGIRLFDSHFKDCPHAREHSKQRQA